jgi:hypothetical protein
MVVGMTNTNMPRTAAATAAASRNADERRAEHLRDRGWICIPPEQPVCTHYDRDPRRVRRLELEQ